MKDLPMNLRRFSFTLSLLVSIALTFASCHALTDEARAKGFVYLSDVDSTIQVSMRYATTENFMGRVVPGYERNGNKAIMTRQAAEALADVQADVKKDGYSLLVYDAYRPQHVVDAFAAWGEDLGAVAKKLQYYPRVSKSQVFDLGYIARRSGHSRGSTVDLTLIKLEDSLHAVVETGRTLEGGVAVKFLDDGTVDMGTSFDLFDEASHHENDLISDEAKERREYLKDAMLRHGFKILADEWWHYTLRAEPYPAADDSSYFNFPVE